MPFSIEEVASGKLAEHIAADATSPFSTDDWTDLDNVTGVSVTSSGAINVTASGGSVSGILYSAVAARSCGMVEAEITRLNADSTQSDSGVGLHVADALNAVYATLEFTDTLQAGDFRLRDLSSGTHVGATAVVGSVYDKGTFHWVALGVDALASRAWSDSDSTSVELSSDDGTERASGQAALLARKSAAASYGVRAKAFYYHAGKDVTVTGLRNDYKAKVLDSTDGVLGSATESGGTATVEMSSIGRRNNPTTVIVTDRNDTELARFTADSSVGIWGGQQLRLKYTTSAIAGRKGVISVASASVGSVNPWYPIVTGDYWTGMASTDTGQRFVVTNAYITAISTSGQPGIVDDEYVIGVGSAIVAEVRDFQIHQEAEQVDGSYHGAVWDEQIQGIGTWSGSAETLFVPGDATHKDLFDLIVDSERASFEFYPTGSSSDGYFSGNGYIQDWNLAHPNSAAAAQQVAFVGTGTLTRTSSST